MTTPEQYRHRQRSIVFVAMLLFSMVLLILQLWLFVSALEDLIAGRTAMVMPGAFSSAVILAVQVWMYLGLRRMERRP